MAKRSGESLESIIQASISRAMARVAPRVAKVIAAAAAAQADEQIVRMARKGRPRPGKKPSRARVEITKWTADARARRVPTFVIEATGLDTKKKIVAKYGPATFEKGMPVPPALGEKKGSQIPVPRKAQGKKAQEKQSASVSSEKKAAPDERAPVAVARPPVVRKRSAIA